MLRDTAHHLKQYCRGKRSLCDRITVAEKSLSGSLFVFLYRSIHANALYTANEKIQGAALSLTWVSIKKN